MSEEKLYAVRNDGGQWADPGYTFGSGAWVTPDKAEREEDAKHHGGHVVTLVEEPEKVVVSPEEAELVKNCLWTNLQDAFLNNINLLFRGRRPEDITRLKSALTNGYTVAKEKKYRVITPKSWWASENEPEYMHMNVLNGIENYKGADDDTLFTQKQLDLYGLNGSPFTKEEVTDDGKD